MSFYMSTKVLTWLIFLEHYIIRASHCQFNWSPIASCLCCNVNAAGEDEQDWTRTCPPFPASQWKAGQAAMDAASLQSVTFSHRGNEQTDVTKALEIKTTGERGLWGWRLSSTSCWQTDSQASSEITNYSHTKWWVLHATVPGALSQL